MDIISETRSASNSPLPYANDCHDSPNSKPPNALPSNNGSWDVGKERKKNIDDDVLSVLQKEWSFLSTTDIPSVARDGVNSQWIGQSLRSFRNESFVEIPLQDLLIRANKGLDTRHDSIQWLRSTRATPVKQIKAETPLSPCNEISYHSKQSYSPFKSFSDAFSPLPSASVKRSVLRTGLIAGERPKAKGRGHSVGQRNDPRVLKWSRLSRTDVERSLSAEFSPSSSVACEPPFTRRSDNLSRPSSSTEVRHNRSVSVLSVSAKSSDASKPKMRPIWMHRPQEYGEAFYCPAGYMDGLSLPPHKQLCFHDWLVAGRVQHCYELLEEYVFTCLGGADERASVTATLRLVVFCNTFGPRVAASGKEGLAMRLLQRAETLTNNTEYRFVLPHRNDLRAWSLDNLAAYFFKLRKYNAASRYTERCQKFESKIRHTELRGLIRLHHAQVMTSSNKSKEAMASLLVALDMARDTLHALNLGHKEIKLPRTSEDARKYLELLSSQYPEEDSITTRVFLSVRSCAELTSSNLPSSSESEDDDEDDEDNNCPKQGGASDRKWKTQWAFELMAVTVHNLCVQHAYAYEYDVALTRLVQAMQQLGECKTSPTPSVISALDRTYDLLSELMDIKQLIQFHQLEEQQSKLQQQPLEEQSSSVSSASGTLPKPLSRSSSSMSLLRGASSKSLLSHSFSSLNLLRAPSFRTLPVLQSSPTATKRQSRTPPKTPQKSPALSPLQSPSSPSTCAQPRARPEDDTHTHAATATPSNTAFISALSPPLALSDGRTGTSPSSPPLEFRRSQHSSSTTTAAATSTALALPSSPPQPSVHAGGYTKGSPALRRGSSPSSLEFRRSQSSAGGSAQQHQLKSDVKSDRTSQQRSHRSSSARGRVQHTLAGDGCEKSDSTSADHHGSSARASTTTLGGSTDSSSTSNTNAATNSTTDTNNTTTDSSATNNTDANTHSTTTASSSPTTTDHTRKSARDSTCSDITPTSLTTTNNTATPPARRPSLTSTTASSHLLSHHHQPYYSSSPLSSLPHAATDSPLPDTPSGYSDYTRTSYTSYTAASSPPSSLADSDVFAVDGGGSGYPMPFRLFGTGTYPSPPPQRPQCVPVLRDMPTVGTISVDVDEACASLALPPSNYTSSGGGYGSHSTNNEFYDDYTDDDDDDDDDDNNNNNDDNDDNDNDDDNNNNDDDNDDNDDNDNDDDNNNDDEDGSYNDNDEYSRENTRITAAASDGYDDEFEDDYAGNDARSSGWSDERPSLTEDGDSACSRSSAQGEDRSSVGDSEGVLGGSSRVGRSEDGSVGGEDGLVASSSSAIAEGSMSVDETEDGQCVSLSGRGDTRTTPTSTSTVNDNEEGGTCAGTDVSARTSESEEEHHTTPPCELDPSGSAEHGSLSERDEQDASSRRVEHSEQEGQPRSTAEMSEDECFWRDTSIETTIAVAQSPTPEAVADGNTSPSAEAMTAVSPVIDTTMPFFEAAAAVSTVTDTAEPTVPGTTTPPADATIAIYTQSLKLPQ